ncbi:TIGR01777 family oxidoreductase [Roseibacillus ishigakijimensis]|uniref:TIGR01777 family oxidoreductase n=1 Tax=Roseibacillus ishigakijimensis TaxID=454146 RepID=A0A934VLE1_9BACT|nr:TIGR01777 family oxidoreductase [Roseibacillus ishigakijimensis]MBK1834589.1 TIGR01777 family oxidoreductase [Roseibacillus ishigakijimensis]
MKIGIVGAAGLLGKALRGKLESSHHQWVGFSRAPEGREGEWRSLDDGFGGLDGVVNVAGEAIDKRWTQKNREKFHESRIGVTERIVASLAAMAAEERPRVLLNASAVGYYGDRGEELLTEGEEAGPDYLARLCLEWEAAAREAEALEVRVVLGRIGVVLGPGAPAWERLQQVFQWGLGGRLGDGRQYWSPVHLDDVAGGMVHALETDEVVGPMNLVAPGAVTNGEMTRMLGEVMHRPTLFPVPALALKVVLGGFSSALLSSQRVEPKVLQETGYQFAYANPRALLEALSS